MSQVPTGSETQNVDNLITELRASLASSQTLLSNQATRLSTVIDLEAELSRLKTELAFMSAAREAVEAQLKNERAKREAEEEIADDLRAQVDTLRGQVEQARKGVGLLQKQEKDRKRMSQIGGLGLLPAETFAEEVVTDKAVKRQSTIVLKGHRRASSQSEGSDLVAAVHPSSTSANPTSRPGLRELKLGTQTQTSPGSISSPLMGVDLEDPSKATRTVSAGAAGGSPSKRDALLREAAAREAAAQEAAEAAAREAEHEHGRLQKELRALQRKLDDSEEARIASETCLKALRDFIAGGTGGDADGIDLSGRSAAEALKGISLPPLPTDRDAEFHEPAEREKPLPPKPDVKSPPRKGSNWNFSLWRQPSSPAMSTTVEPPVTPQPMLSPPASIRTSSATKTSPLPTQIELDEEGLNRIPDAGTPLDSYVTSWSRTVPPPSGSAAPPPTPAGAVPMSPPPPPNATRKLSSFFGLVRREDKLPESHEFDAHDAFTPEERMTDRLEPSPMIAEGDYSMNVSEAGSRRTSAPSHQTTDSAVTEEVGTPMLSPMSTAPPMLESGTVEDGFELGQKGDQIQV